MGRAAAGIGTAVEVDQRQESNSSWFRGQQGSNRGRCQKAAGVKQQQETNPISTTTDLVRLNLHSQPNPCHTASNYQPTDPIRTIPDPVQLTLYNQPSYCTDPKYRLTSAANLVRLLTSVASLVRLLTSGANLIRPLTSAVNLVRLLTSVANLVWLLTSGANLLRLLTSGANLIRLLTSVANLKLLSLSSSRPTLALSGPLRSGS